MTKTELREAYVKARGKYAGGHLGTNEYALELDTMLSGYFGLPLFDPPEESDYELPRDPEHPAGHEPGPRP